QATARAPSLPLVRLGGEVGALVADDAEALAGRCLHHPPRADLLQPLGAERLEPAHLGLDVVGLDVQVHAAGVVDLLHLDMQVVRFCLQQRIAGVLRALRGPSRQAERPAPELGRGLSVARLAIADETRQPAAMHGLLPILMVRPAAYPVDSPAGFAYYSWQRRFELPACGRFTNAAKAVAGLPRR